jgi:hypothetical protein
VCWVAEIGWLGIMIFALEKDDGSLFVFESVTQAEAEFEAIDVENGEYEFCDHTGQRFIAELTAPARAFRAGSYRLRPSNSRDTELLSRLLARATCLVRSLGDFHTIDDLRRVYDA